MIDVMQTKIATYQARLKEINAAINQCEDVAKQAQTKRNNLVSEANYMQGRIDECAEMFKGSGAESGMVPKSESIEPVASVYDGQSIENSTSGAQHKP